MQASAFPDDRIVPRLPIQGDSVRKERFITNLGKRLSRRIDKKAFSATVLIWPHSRVRAKVVLNVREYDVPGDSITWHEVGLVVL